MTEDRLIEILKQHGGHESQRWIIEAMKIAVNEVLDNAANNADTICANAKKGQDTCGSWCGGCDSAIVNKSTILNLKIK